MTRFLLPLIALVLVLTACGAGDKSAPPVTRVASRQDTIAARRAAASREASRLLVRFVAPAGSQRLQKAPRPVLTFKPNVMVAKIAGPHRFYRVDAPLLRVVSAVEARAPRGFDARVTGENLSPPGRLVYIRPSSAGDFPKRFLTVNAVSFRGRTYFRVDADAVWIYPRSPAERLPAGIRAIAIHTPKKSATVTDPARVATIVRWFDALPIVPPGVGQMCALTVDDVRLSFRNSSGKAIAAAAAPEGPAGYCNAIGFSVRGRSRRPDLEDATMRIAASFVGRIQRLLGLKLVAG